MKSKLASVMALGAGVAALTVPVAHAGRAEPVPIYGFYTTYLDHSRQTFNGRPAGSDPSVQGASFTTSCTAEGCTAHWLLTTQLGENPSALSLFDYHWTGDRWESSGNYPFHCDGGGSVTAFRSDFLAPNPDESFSGERTFTVAEPGCPGDGAGTYWLPFNVTPTDAPTIAPTDAPTITPTDAPPPAAR